MFGEESGRRRFRRGAAYLGSEPVVICGHDNRPTDYGVRGELLGPLLGVGYQPVEPVTERAWAVRAVIFRYVPASDEGTVHGNPVGAR